MKIGVKEININPTFPVYRMLGRHSEKILDVLDDLNCRIIAFELKNHQYFFHVSIDTVELWEKREHQIKEAIESVLNKEIICLTSATHSHNCPCMTLDDDYVDFVLERIKTAVQEIEMKEYKECSYIYDYAYFDKVGKSRIEKHVTPHIYAETVSIYGDGKRILTFLIHNVHPTTKELWKDPFTAEYPGYCIRELKKDFPNEFFTFLLGPAGDLSPHFVRKDRSIEEMYRLAELLKQEFKRQLNNQESIQKKQLDFKFETTLLPKELEEPKLHFPEDLTEEEKKVKKMFEEGHLGGPKRKLRDFEIVDHYRISHLIFSNDYSMIFEPFELYSEYYGAVDKSRCSIISIANGFEHYLMGLHINRLSLHGSLNKFSDGMKRKMWEILSKWSCQEKL